MITIDFVVGDSIAAGVAISGFGLGRSGDSGKPPSKDDKGISQVGANPTTVLGFLNEIGADKLKSKNIVLSSGISNGLDDIEVVKKQLEFLQSLSAKVYLIGVTNNPSDTKPKFIGMNKKLEDLCTQFSYKFLGGFEPGDTQKVHPNYREYYKTNIKPVLEAGEGQDVSTNLENEKNKDKSPEAGKLPAAPVIPEIDPEKIFIFNVEKENLFRNADIGSFSLVPIEVEFEFSGKQDEFLLDEEFVEEEFIGLSEFDKELRKEVEILELTIGTEKDIGSNASGNSGLSNIDENIDLDVRPANLSRDEKDKILEFMKYLVKNGLTKEQAAGIAGNVKGESGFKEWNVENGKESLRGSGIGLMQWTGNNLNPVAGRRKWERFIGTWLKNKGTTSRWIIWDPNITSASSTRRNPKKGSWVLNTDPKSHNNGASIETNLQTIDGLWEASLAYSLEHIRVNKPYVQKNFNGNLIGNTRTIFNNGFFVYRNGDKPDLGVEGSCEIFLCDGEVPQTVIDALAGTNKAAYRESVQHRVSFALAALELYNSQVT